MSMHAKQEELHPKSLAEGLDLSIVIGLTPGVFSNAGFLCSLTYKQRLFKMFDAHSMNAADRTWVFIFVTMLRNKVKILHVASQMMLNENQENARKFIRDCCVQWPQQGSPGFFPMGKICSSCPTIAAFIWARLTVPAQRTPEKFVQNPWAAQLRLSSGLLRHQKAWEMARFGNRFNESYWIEKSADSYPLMDKDGEEIKFSDRPYSSTDVKEWLAIF